MHSFQSSPELVAGFDSAESMEIIEAFFVILKVFVGSIFFPILTKPMEVNLEDLRKIHRTALFIDLPVSIVQIDIIHTPSYPRCLLIARFNVETADVTPFSATLSASHMCAGVVLPPSELTAWASHLAPLFNGLLDQPLWFTKLSTLLMRRFINIVLPRTRGQILLHTRQAPQ